MKIAFTRVRGGSPASRGRVAKTPLLPRKFAVWQGFLASHAIQGRIRALVTKRKDGKSNAILERFSGKFGPVVLDSRLGFIPDDIFPKKDSGVVVMEGACAAGLSL